MFDRQKIAMILAEFLGAGILSSVVLSMVARTSFPFFAAAGAGFTMLLLVIAVGDVSGAHANPAVTLGMWTLKKIKTEQAVVYIAAQMLGGLVAWKLGQYLLNTNLVNLATTKFDWRVFVAEAVGAMIFGMAIAGATYKNLTGLQRAALIGTGLFLGILVASLGSNGVLNPAVALGIRSWNFAYITGPIVGVVVGMNVYALTMLEPVKPASRSKKR